MSAIATSSGRVRPMPLVASVACFAVAAAAIPALCVVWFAMIDASIEAGNGFGMFAVMSLVTAVGIAAALAGFRLLDQAIPSRRDHLTR